MRKSQQLSADDMVKIYRLIGECRDLGHDSVAWRRHLLTELTRHIGAVLGISAEYHECFDKFPRVVGDLEVGWFDPADHVYRQRHIEECGFSDDAHFRGMVLSYKEKPELMAANRVEYVSDRVWYQSIHFNEFRKPTRLDSSLYAACPLAGGAADSLFGFGLTRALNEPGFTQHDREFCYWLLHELGPLIGRQLEAPGEPSLSVLSPRLQQTLQCLLEGDSEKQAAVRLGVSKATVHEYVTALYPHFGVRSRAELLARWLRFGR